MVNLQFVKNDSYEKGTDLMVVNVYVKAVCRQSARVIFREQDFTLIFQTRWGSQSSAPPSSLQRRVPQREPQRVSFPVFSDVNFLRLHPDCGANTVFKWQVKLR